MQGLGELFSDRDDLFSSTRSVELKSNIFFFTILDKMGDQAGVIRGQEAKLERSQE